MAEDVKVTNLHDSGSPARVALELARLINDYEYGYGSKPPENPREYWLDLYADCLWATRGHRDAKSK
jgi:hypothetical protein